MNPDSLSIRHLIALIAGALCIAFAPIFAVLSVRIGGVGYFDAAFWRLFIGALAMGAFLAIFHRKKTDAEWLGPGRIWGWIWIPGVAFAGDFWAWHWSFEHTSVANATLLANVAIVIVTLFAWLVWKERITPKFVSGALLAFCGVVVLMISSQHRPPPAEGNPVFGDFLALATACFYATYQLSMKYYRRKRSAPVLMFWASVVAAVCLFPVAWFHPDAFWPESAKGWWMLIALGVISHACGQGLIAYAFGGLPASLATVVLLVQPLATAGLGVVILGQELVRWQVIGGCGVMIGLFLAIRGQLPKRD